MKSVINAVMDITIFHIAGLAIAILMELKRLLAKVLPVLVIRMATVFARNWLRAKNVVRYYFFLQDWGFEGEKVV